ncbi:MULTISPECIES: hypothetical protein [Pseudomonas]|uniref:hypothetical protein n=1 Tax=Pseudomonas TaxID=286 RepID=UPI000586D27B|nr:MULTISPECIES: hypothetical protein [Pseudomonas]AZC47845.1 hypothetical protein C4K35_0231 [Pseudomonas chlororaphis subsp. piscium]AZC54426.1 hypothetical protein C4K34_0230 [Pseudomonas chlororaphis subsp. piscium]AZC66924.1 hypothetical protein C4K32_0231 [Pseudomonas chlororaphis subsp. piscium]AZC79375.1 hypothetical protein C4K30_0230 [Pseudomonas chlororaphis subsp. piscium]AZC86562.1 hypothetical protein C4K29_0229 [Pseudomonas chlororaphis subsp. piscium]
MNTLTLSQRSIIHNCLLDLKDSSSLNNSSFLPIALDKLIASEGFGIEMSGVFISTDEDLENIPEYLKEGIAFEFMGEHVVLSFSDGVSAISNWCDNNAMSDRESILLKCKILKAKFSTED